MGGRARCGSALLWAACVAVLGCTPSGKEASEAPPGAGPSEPAPPGAPAPQTPTETEAPSDPGSPRPLPTDGGTPVDGGSPGGAVIPEEPKPTVCAPTGGEPRWLQEGEPLTVTLGCGTGHTDAALRFTVEPLPPGASVDEASGTLRWTPGKDQAAVWMLTVTERTTGEKGHLKVGVADNWQASGNVPVVDAARHTEEYGLPVFHLTFADRMTAGGYIPATLVYRGRTYTMEAKYRGATSSGFPKRSYTFKFQDEDKFDEPFLAGFMDRRRLVMISPFNDNSYLRPRLAFGLWNRMSPEHIQIKTYSAVLYTNGQYRGLFTVADHVSKQLFKRHGLNPDGDLFKAVDADANFSLLDAEGAAKSHLAQGYEKKEGLINTSAPIVDITAWVADTGGASFREGWESRMVTRDYEDWWIFNTLILGADSSAKNAYHYRDTPGNGRWRYIPWDLDASFGQGWDTKRYSSDARPNYSEDNLLFARMLADPAIAGPMRARYQALLKNELSAEVVLGMLEAYEKEIRPSALRDEARWGKQYREFVRWNYRTDYTTHDEEVEYLRRWIAERWDMLERRLP